MPGIIFHYFHDGIKYKKSQGSLDANTFKSLISYLMEKYTILSMEEYVHKAISGKLNETDVCLTFDDGIRSQIEVALPVLNEAGIRAGFFVYTEPFCGRLSQLEVDHDFRFLHYDNVDCFYSDFFNQLQSCPNIYTLEVQKRIELFSYNDYKPECTWHTFNDKLFRYVRSILLNEQDYRMIMDALMLKFNYSAKDRTDFLWMTQDELCQLRDMGHMIGLHSHTHPTSLQNMNFEAKMQEYIQNIDVLKSIANIVPSVAAYPCGNCDDDTRKIMELLGINAAFLARPSHSQDQYALSRINHTEFLKEMLWEKT